MTKRRARGAKLEPRTNLRRKKHDVAQMQFVGRNGVTELAIVADAYWGGTESGKVAAARRLRDFTDNELIRTWVRDVSRPNRYTLTEKGAAWVGEDGIVLRTKMQAFGPGADHVVMISRLWSAFAARLSRAGSPKLAQFVTEGEIRRAISQRRNALICDGIAVIEQEAVRSVALEVDLGEERADVIASKLRKYHPYLRERRPYLGIGLHALLIAARGMPRLARFAVEAHRAEIGSACFFIDLEMLSKETVVDTVATIPSMSDAVQRGGNAFRHSLLEELSCH